jgi:hypothetical protein
MKMKGLVGSFTKTLMEHGSPFFIRGKIASEKVHHLERTARRLEIPERNLPPKSEAFF